MRKVAFGLNAKPLMASIDEYSVSIPSKKRQYMRTEVGLSYTAKLTKRLEVGVNGLMHFDKVKKLERQKFGVQMQYKY